MENNENGTKSILGWLSILGITALAFYAFYYLDFSAPIKAMIWIGWFIVTLFLAYTTTQGKRAFEFAKEAKQELIKVVWPTRQETVQTTSIVMIMVAVTGFVLWGIDTGMMWMIGKITHLG